MKEDEIKEYLKRVDELELKLTGEDKDTYQWLLFGYNECARLLNEKEEVIKEAREYNQKIVDDYLKEDDCEYCDGRYATATHNLEILSKGENK